MKRRAENQRANWPAGCSIEGAFEDEAGDVVAASSLVVCRRVELEQVNG